MKRLFLILILVPLIGFSQTDNVESSIKKLIDLKELKDSGVLTEDEYNKAAAPHKKIVMGL